MHVARGSPRASSQRRNAAAKAEIRPSTRSRPTGTGAPYLVKKLTDTGWPLPAGFTLQPGDRPAKSGALEHQFENFKAMCALYVGGDQQYVPYRVQSGNAHPSYIGAMAYIVPETGELSTTAATDSYVDLVDTARCVILARHAFAPLLTDTSLADAVIRAETTLGIEFALWRRL